MEKIKFNKYIDIFYFIWDNKDETIEMVNEYLKNTKGEHFKCGRCWDPNTESNTSENLYISETTDEYQTNSWFRIGEYVVDCIDFFAVYSDEQFSEEEIIRVYAETRGLEIYNRIDISSMTNEEIKDEMTKLSKQIRDAEIRMKEVRAICKHKVVKEANYSWRTGSYQLAEICEYCGELIRYK